MNLLFIRNDDLVNSFYLSCEVQLVKSFVKSGHKAKLIGVGNQDKFEDETIYFKAPFRKRTLFLMKIAIFLPFYCKKNNINVVIMDASSIPASIFLLLFKKILSVKTVFDVRSVPVEQKLRWDYKVSCIIAQKYFSGVTFITEGTKNYVEELINRKFNKSAIFPSAVNVNVFSPSKSNSVPEEITEKIKDKIVLFYHGSISPNRGVTLILDALNQLKDEYPNLILISISNNNELLTDYCSENNYNLKDQLLLLDIIPHEKLPSYINLADICIVPLLRIKWWEISSPLKLMEYLAMAKPIILSDIEAHLSVVDRESDFSVFFNPDDSSDLGKKIKIAVSNLENLKKNSFKGREIVENKYSWDIQANIIKEFAEQI